MLDFNNLLLQQANLGIQSSKHYFVSSDFAFWKLNIYKYTFMYILFLDEKNNLNQISLLSFMCLAWEEKGGMGGTWNLGGQEG